MGFALPACECGNVPVARRMLASGAPLGTAFGFLFAAPVLNPIVLASTWAAFPDQPWLLIARPLGAFGLAVLLSLSLTLLPERQLLAMDLLSERRMNQPSAASDCLDRSSGLIGTGVNRDPLLETQPVAERPSPSRFWSRAAVNAWTSSVCCCWAAWCPQWCRPGCPEAGCWRSAPHRTASILALMLLAVVVSVCSSVDAFRPSIRSPGDPRSPAGLSVAGSCGRPQIGGSVQCADATPSHCHHNGNRKPGGPTDCAVDQPVAAVKGASR